MVLDTIISLVVVALVALVFWFLPGDEELGNESESPGEASRPNRWPTEPVPAESELGKRCPLCATDFGAGDELANCTGCYTSYHLACVNEFRRCGTVGCKYA